MKYCIYKLWIGICCLLKDCKCQRPSPANPNPKIEANPFKFMI
jgi:hypothetical protein